MNTILRRYWIFGLVCFGLIGVTGIGCQKDSRTVPLTDSTRSQDVSTTPNREPAASPEAAVVPPSLDDIDATSKGTSAVTASVPAPPSLLELRAERDGTVWKMETIAQRYERRLVQLWDELLIEQRRDEQVGNPSESVTVPAESPRSSGERGDPFAVFAKQPLRSIKVGKLGPETPIRWGATVASLDQETRTVNGDEWPTWVDWFRQQGYQIVQTEWHHAQFDRDAEGVARSTVNMSIYGTQEGTNTRFVLTGDLKIEWGPTPDDKAIPEPAHLDATGLRYIARRGTAPFREVLTVDHTIAEKRSGVQPIALHDFNDDGLPELVLGGSNERFWNQGVNRFERDTLLSYPERGFETSLIADVTGDGQVDYLMPGLAGDLLMYAGDSEGKFGTLPKGKARSGGPLQQPQVFAAGDVDRDGDLDLWIGQYKISYVGGQMPTPYYDANDGLPAYLLLNDGTGKFVPHTEEAGLAAKQFRRSYGGAFVDLDEDRDLDLLVVSDFAGIDLYANDGKGYFTDVTKEAVDESHLFGMSATFADFNVDGHLDFFVTGMASTTARRLEHMRLGRTDRPDVHLMRSRMGYGNRMYIQEAESSAKGKFRQPNFKDQVARTGWSWGSAAFDFDNDGFPDLAVANGHSSGQSTKDHCSHFWCHDIYDATSQPNPEILSVFNTVLQGYYTREESWDGYQKNQLLLNLDGSGFVNLGFLMGVGHEYDGRAVIAGDLDADGRIDLCVVEDQWQKGQILHVYRNELDTPHHWIGLRYVDRPGPDTPLGMTVILELVDGSRRVACVTAGDSIHAQHDFSTHFGLGECTEVKSIELLLVSGKSIQLDRPEIDRYHRVEIE